jgi:hypothetical protein
VSGAMAMMACFIAVRRGVDGAGFSTNLTAVCGQMPPRLGLGGDRTLAKILEQRTVLVCLAADNRLTYRCRALCLRTTVRTS